MRPSLLFICFCTVPSWLGRFLSQARACSIFRWLFYILPSQSRIRDTDAEIYELPEALSQKSLHSQEYLRTFTII